MSSVAQLENLAVTILSPSDHKTELRARIRASRKKRSAADQFRLATALADVVGGMPELHQAKCVAAYVARPGEPGTEETLTRLRNRGVPVLLPVLTAGLDRGWAYDLGPEDREVAAPGRPPEPTTEHLPATALESADVILAPALAVDQHGTRLGQGGGWYDRALTYARDDALIVAMVYDEEFEDADIRLPREPHDRPVHVVATPARLMRLTQPVPPVATEPAPSTVEA